MMATDLYSLLEITPADDYPPPGEFVASERPTSVTVVSTLLIVLALVVIVAAAVVVSSIDDSIPLVYTMVFIMLAAAVIQLITGIGMLNGRNWARLLFLWLTPINVVLGIAGGSGGSVALLLWYIPCAIILTRPKARAYFIPASAAAPATST